MSDDPIAPVAHEILNHMNNEHTEHMLQYLRAFTDVQDATYAKMTGLDRHGFDVEAETPGGARTVRIGFAFPLNERVQVREEMVRLTTEAQAKLGIQAEPAEHH